MKKYLFFLPSIIISCSVPNECPELNYDPIDKLTTLSDSSLFTGRCSIYENGKLRAIQQYINGVDHGNWVFYFPNGKIETKGKFLNGKRVGKWKYYFESGNLNQISRYSKTGERNGKWVVYNPDGSVAEEINY